ncbi:hypothetical protein QKU48_gp0847 [Fadolivirus algeromassiliense]|uniref:Uncharacterized protein n=1 Tax=Fadolivirus FV1/VV64 TaxID=3070911 RepID=A0A7D3QUN9_9VIRU|nr:hypothetical protein QKU48_gp0847 [Fadolivirus algeromassiliense]QKF94305.1 hypothetical protein Fadolivirus_1_847 [Fadolivirus FV1/VV64]
MLFVTSKGQLEMFTSDEAVKNVASLYSQGNLTVTKITTPEIVGQNNSLKVTGNLSVPGQIGSPTIDGINGNINNINNRINDLSNQLNGVRESLPSCNWSGERIVCGNCLGSQDDYMINCQNGKITGFRVLG